MFPEEEEDEYYEEDEEHVSAATLMGHTGTTGGKHQ